MGVFFHVSLYILTVPLLISSHRPVLFTVAMSKITLYQPFLSFLNMLKTNNLQSNVLLNVKGNNNLVFKCHKCVTIPMNTLDYKGLKSKAIVNEQLIGGFMDHKTSDMHDGRQRVLIKSKPHCL